MDCKQRVGIDLHIHTTASDGTSSPAQILTLARELELGAIAITDHDTLDSVKTSLQLGIPPELKFLTGVEISATPPPPFRCPGSFHILGYGFRPEDPVLNQILFQLQDARNNRNPRIIERLNRLGLDLSLEEVSQIAGHGLLGRPHIARLMVKKGYASSINDAFDNYLGKGKPAYVDKFRVDTPQAIKLISDAGGLPILAHPYLLETESEKELEDLVVMMKTMGLKGLEVYYPDHPPEHTALYVALAQKHGLLMTGGTDFHGALKPEIHLGTGKGDFFVPYELYETLQQHISR
ncbi:MAG: PHP domain-containing protein [Thermodesulfobacteriota bacterium]